MRILVVEDDKNLSDLITRGLRQAGYAVDAAYDGEEGQYLAENYPYDLIILDLILPKKDGIEVCQVLRRNKLNTRILMLTCRGELGDRVKGLDSGADDYMVKPFAFEELTARIRTLLRREVGQASPVITVGELSMNTVTREVKLGQRPIELTNKEYSILEYFMINPDVLVTRRMIEDHIWDMSLDTASNLITAYINRIRSKLEDRENSLIETVRGAGYRLRLK
jgi:DNA-binding response OmpR family regulator